MSKVIVIGAGPAGIMAAIHASKEHEVILLDGNEKLGRKLFITGKGRCNVTNAKDISEFFDYIPGNPHFLYSALYSFTNEDTMNFFENEGIKLKVERGDRVFPESDKSSDIIKGLSNALSRTNTKIKLGCKVTDIKVKDKKISEVVINNSEILKGDYFIIATGGASYPLTGSKGEGQNFAKKLGHNIVPLRPALVPMVVKNAETKELQGLSLRNVEVTMKENDKKVIYKNFGEMLFTHFGVSGPLMLRASSFAADAIKKNNLRLVIDLKPALSQEQLDMRLVREFEIYKNKQFKNAVVSLFPAKLIPIMIELSGIHPDKKVNEITKEERLSFVSLIKNMELTLTGLCDYNQAIITKGGVSVKEINPTTMESKLVKQLYFIGEVLDLDALTGGFNLQIAWSSAYAAGSSMW